MNFRQEIIRLLDGALTDADNRVAHIKAFQALVWNGIPDEAFDESTAEKLRELAYDIYYYQPDPELRRESDVYFGEDKAIDLLRSSLRWLKR